jgi:hypothetical protein
MEKPFGKGYMRFFGRFRFLRMTGEEAFAEVSKSNQKLLFVILSARNW